MRRRAFCYCPAPHSGGAGRTWAVTPAKTSVTFTKPFNGQDMDTYAADLHELVTSLNLGPAIHVGHSNGGGEVACNCGTKRVAKAVLVPAVPPLMLKTPANPGGTPISVFDGLRASVRADRSLFWMNLALPFYGCTQSSARRSVARGRSARAAHCAVP